MTKWGAAVAVVAATGCAALGPTAPVEGVRRAAFPVAVRFTSDVADPYWVMAGPSETYRSIRVNDRLRGRLEAYARAKSGPEGNPLDVLVHLERVDTAYGQLGRRGGGGTRLARAAPRTLTDALPMRLGSDREFDDGRPYRITKTVEVTLRAEASADGRLLAREPITVRLEETTEHDDIDLWTYDYLPLVDRALGEAVARLDEIVERAAALRSP